VSDKSPIDWLQGLDHRDWLFDGSVIRGKVMLARFNNLDWSKAWVDIGPSVAGNLGPYWHVPLKETIIDGELYDCGDTVHRLYPKVLTTKWLLLIRQACIDHARLEVKRSKTVTDVSVVQPALASHDANQTEATRS
jgi:hypothetical protein